MKMKPLALSLLAFLLFSFPSFTALGIEQNAEVRGLKDRILVLETDLKKLDDDQVVHSEIAALKALQLEKLQDENDENFSNLLIFITILVAMATFMFTVFAFIITLFGLFGFLNYKDLKKLVSEAKTTLLKIKKHEKDAEASKNRTENYENSLFSDSERTQEQKDEDAKELDILEKTTTPEERTKEEWFKLGFLHASKEEYKDAIPCFTEFLNREPLHLISLMNRGMCFQETQNHKAALKDYSTVITIGELDKKIITSQQENFSFIYNNRGTYYSENQEQHHLALEDYNKAIELKANNAEALNNRGALYFKKEDTYDLALQDYNKAIEFRPQFANAYYNRSGLYAKKEETYDLAIDDLSKAIEFKDDDDFYATRGALYSQKVETFGLALEDYKKAIELAPEKAPTYFNKIELLLCMKRYPESDKALFEAKKFSKEDDYPIIFPLLENILHVADPKFGKNSDLEEIIAENQELEIDWEFDELEAWRDRANDLTDEQKEEITKLIEMVKEHKERNS